MINLKLLRSDSDFVKYKIKLKDPLFDVDRLIYLDEQLIKLKIEIDSLLNKSNEFAKICKNGIVSDEIREDSKKIKLLIQEKKKELENSEKEFLYIYLRCPNIPQDSLPIGNKDANKVISQFGSAPSFSFTPLNHIELLVKSNLIDLEIASTISKSGFILYKNDIVWIMYKLCMFFLKHNEENGYKITLPPYVVNRETITAASNLPKFEDDVFLCEKDDLFLIPTAEVALASLLKDKIIQEEELPIRYTSWTSCFRRESGGYGSNERGLIRVHQFEKVENFVFSSPENSEFEHNKMLECSESILKKLNLHYRVSLLSTEDCSFASSKTFDIEIWLPGQNQYKEVSSISNCTDFQSRRSRTRFRSKINNNINLVHTLNGSSLALPRLMIALFETYQDKNGVINIEEINNLIDKASALK
jgi:seryl-tRNA synthetase